MTFPNTAPSGQPKIAVVLNTAWNIYNFRTGLIKALQAQGFDVVAIAPKDEYVGKIREMGIPFIPVKNLKRKGTNPTRDARLVRELTGIYQSEGIDLVLQYTIKPVIYGTIAAHHCGVKTINTLTGLGYAFLSKGLVNRLVQVLYRYTLKKADQVFFQNKDDLQLFLDNDLVDQHKAGIIHGSGIDTDYFQADSSPGGQGDLQFLFIGRLLEDKGIHEFVEAASMIKQSHPGSTFHVVGDLDAHNPSGISQQQLDDWVSHGWITFHGHVEDTRPYIEQADVVVLPSYREGLPKVMLEGMSMSRPLIATDAPGCRETVQDGVNGFLCEVKSGTSLATAMERMINASAEDRRAMGHASRQLALMKFDEQLIIKQYLKEMYQLLGLPAQGRMVWIDERETVDRER